MTVVNSPEDLKIAQSIRKEVFVQEMSVPEDIEIDEFESSATHYLLRMDGTDCGTCRVRKTADGQKIERCAVLKDFRNKQAGLKMMQLLLKQLDLTKPIYLHAQFHVQGFYEKVGFVPSGELFYEAKIPHILMIYQPNND